MNRPIHINAFFDGRLGHEKQTRGILMALGRLTQVRISEFRVAPQPPSAVAAGWLRWLASLVVPFSAKSGPVDLIIGSGTATHLPMLLQKSGTRARIVACMSPDCILKPHFDLCFVPLHDRIKPSANLFETIGPPNTAIAVRNHFDGRGLILVGGIDTKSHFWDSAAIMGYIRTICEQRRQIEWTVASSPRTPANMIQQLAEFAERMPRVTFMAAEQTGRGWIEQAYATHADVWVTADSVSMMYEALSAGCRVGVLPVQWKKKNNKFQYSVDYLSASHRIITYEQWRNGSGLIVCPPLNEAQRCAREILRRWWPDRLL